MAEFRVPDIQLKTKNGLMLVINGALLVIATVVAWRLAIWYSSWESHADSTDRAIAELSSKIDSLLRKTETSDQQQDAMLFRWINDLAASNPTLKIPTLDYSVRTH